MRQFARYLPLSMQRALRSLLYGWQIYRGTFRSDEREYEQLSKWIHPGDWVIDIGANVGHYTLELARCVGAGGRVLAFEPNPATMAYLAENCQRAGLMNVTLLNMAASESADEYGFRIPAGRTGLDGHYFAAVDEGGDWRVLGLAVDQLQLAHPIRLVKLDAEGHEAAILRGMPELLQRDHPTLIVEDNDEAVGGYLRDFGYRSRQLPGSRNFVFTVGDLDA